MGFIVRVITKLPWYRNPDTALTPVYCHISMYMTLLNFCHSFLISGHTHGGQFFPVSLIVYICVPYFQGLYHLKEGTYLYVSNGVGFWGIPMRLMAPPEVAVLSLVPNTFS